ncbi:hypothetical protein DID74_00360 [Candidatus Marinamargulisbacteria bacterium SCGC AG-333-B06]|nr:hypothetical protein DID74_00360 [Candidatus Marinamargulisbacteria bacterium SCGC AG-333-B06]
MKKVLIGFTEIASNIKKFKHALELDGYQVFAAIDQLPHFQNNPDIYNIIFAPNYLSKKKHILFKIYKRIYILIKKALFFKHLFQYDYIIYIWNTTLLPFKLDLFLLKIFRKKFLVMFCGDDIRYRPIHINIQEKEYNLFLYKGINKNKFINHYGIHVKFFKSLYHSLWTTYLTNKIISTPDQSTFLKNPYYQFYSPHVNNKIKSLNSPKHKDNKKIYIVHAPSDRIVKSSSYIIDTVNSIINTNSNVEFILLENLTNNKVLEILNKSHILIDQVGVWAARLALEGLENNMIVFGGNLPKYSQHNATSPLINIDQDQYKFKKDLLFIIDKWINDPIYIANKQKESAFFLNKHYSYTFNINRTMSILNSQIPCDVTPICTKEKLLKCTPYLYQKIILKIIL